MSCRIAVFGAGLIGARHVEAIVAEPGCELAAIIDPSKEAAALAARHGVDHFDDANAFTAAGAEAGAGVGADAALIATPNSTHLPIARMCFAAGLPCLIEKPLADTVDDAWAIEAEGRERNIPVLVGHHRRHHDRTKQAVELISSGAIGTLAAAQVTWVLKKPAAYFAKGDWRVRRGGGPVLINLIHEIDLLRFIVGEIVAVSAFYANNLRGNEVEDGAAVLLRFENGALGTVTLSDTAPSPWHFEGGSGENPTIAATGEDGMRLFGTKGSLAFPSMTLWQHDDGEEGHWGTPIRSRQLLSDQELTQGMGAETALREQLRHFCRVVRGQEPPLVSAQDGARNLAVAEALRQSAETGMMVELKG